MLPGLNAHANKGEHVLEVDMSGPNLFKKNSEEPDKIDVEQLDTELIVDDKL